MRLIGFDKALQEKVCILLIYLFFNPREAILLFPEAVEKGQAERGRGKR